MSVFLNLMLLFHSEVWGTVADWLMFSITLITGVLVFKTLDSQIKVQKIEADNHSMSNKQYLRSILPNLQVKGLVLNEMFEQWHLELEVVENTAMNVRVINYNRKDFNPKPPTPNKLSVGYTFMVHMTEEQHYNHFVDHLFSFLVNDVDGNTYIQKVSKLFGEYVTSYPEPYFEMG